MAIRYLQRGETPPAGEPRRYMTSHGYVRLRWKVGTADYVECFEHRYVMGFPDAHVHHINGVKDDNRPENLEVLTATEHRAEHELVDRDLVAEMYRSGMSTPQIGDALGHTAAAVFRALQRAGVATRTISESLRKPTPDDDIRAALLAGEGDKTVARRFGVSPWLVASRRKEFGIAPRRPGNLTSAERSR